MGAICVSPGCSGRRCIGARLVYGEFSVIVGCPSAHHTFESKSISMTVETRRSPLGIVAKLLIARVACVVDSERPGGTDRMGCARHLLWRFTHLFAANIAGDWLWTCRLHNTTWYLVQALASRLADNLYRFVYRCAWLVV